MEIKLQIHTHNHHHHHLKMHKSFTNLTAIFQVNLR